MEKVFVSGDLNLIILLFNAESGFQGYLGIIWCAMETMKGLLSYWGIKINYLLFNTILSTQWDEA